MDDKTVVVPQQDNNNLQGPIFGSTSGQQIVLNDLTPATSAVDIKKAIADSIAQLVPDGKQGVIFGLVGTHGVSAGVASKIGDSWQLASNFSIDGKFNTDSIVATVGIVHSW